MIDWHRPGQQVVSLVTFLRDMNEGEVGPYEKQILMIRRVDVVDREVYFRFEEILNPPNHPHYIECAFLASRFRPVKPTSIESLRALTVLPPSAPVRDLIEA